MLNIKLLFTTLTNLGVTDKTSEESQLVSVVNTALLITLTITAFYVILFYAVGYHYTFILNTIMVCFYPMVL